MGEDDIVELLWKSGRVVQSSQTQRPSSDPPPILRGSGSGGGEEEENAPLPPPPPLPPLHHQNLFIQEDEMYSWLHQSYRQDYLCSELRYSGVASNPATHPQSSISPAPCPFAPYDQRGQTIATRRVENFMNFSWLRGNIFTGGRVEAGVVRESIQLGSSTTPSSSATESWVIPATEGTESRVSQTLAVPGLGQKGKAVVIETAETPSSGVCKAETEPVQIQPATIVEIQGTEEARGSTSRKRSRTAEMHNLAERRRREKINENIKTLQELIPGCNKSTKVSTLDDAIEYVKWLQSQIQMMSTGQGMMPPMMYAGNTQQFMPHMAMDMNRPPPFIPFPDTPFPRPAQMADVGPSYPAPRYPFSGIQTFDPSRVHLRSPQPNPVSNQPQFPAYMNPYSQFAGLHQLQQPPPPPFQSQTTSQMSFGQASCTKEPEDQDNQPTGCKVVRGICASTTASRLRFLDAVPLLVSI